MATESEPIYVLANQCKELFSKYEPNTPLRNIDVLLRDYEERFLAWSAYMGVFADQSISLDCRLRDRADISDLVIGLLDVLANSLERLIIGDESSSDDSSQMHLDNIKIPESIDTEVSDGISKHEREMLDIVETSLVRLSRLGTMIRQSSQASREGRIKEFENESNLTVFENCAKSAINTLYQDCHGNLREQLIRSMVEIHASILYKRSHQQKLNVTRAAPAPSMPTIHEDFNTYTPHQPNIKISDTAGLSSHILPNTSVEIPTAGKGDRRYERPESRPSTLNSSLRQSVIQRKLRNAHMTESRCAASSIQLGSVTYPAPNPQGKDNRDFLLCRWCSEFHPATLFNDARKWSVHMDKDFEPYVCISERCANKERLPRYKTFKEWLAHMNGVHSMRWAQEIHKPTKWVCSIGHKTEFFGTAEALSHHAKEFHLDGFTEAELQAIVNYSYAQYPRDRRICPLCCRDLVSEKRRKEVPSITSKRLKLLGDGSDEATAVSTTQSVLSSQESRDNEGDESITELPETIMARHVASHLQVITFLTSRLMDCGEEGDSNEGDDNSHSNIKTDRLTINLPETWSSKLSGQSDINSYDEPDDIISSSPHPRQEDIELHIPDIQGGTIFTSDNLHLFTSKKDITLEPSEGSCIGLSGGSQLGKMEHNNTDYTIGLECDLQIEFWAVLHALDRIHRYQTGDEYALGEVGEHNVVVILLESMTAESANSFSSKFTGIKFILRVGTGSGAPNQNNDIRLGDIVISQPAGSSTGHARYHQPRTPSLTVPASAVSEPESPALAAAVLEIRSIGGVEIVTKILRTVSRIRDLDIVNLFAGPHERYDMLFEATYRHIEQFRSTALSCTECDTFYTIPRLKRKNGLCIHYGTIARGPWAVNEGLMRDYISIRTGALCLKVETIPREYSVPFLMIQGISDYADGHKIDGWIPDAALTAAAYAKELILRLPKDSDDDVGAAGTDQTSIEEQPAIEQRPIVKQQSAAEEKFDIREPTVIEEPTSAEKSDFSIPFDIPFPRNPNFIGREYELSRIHSYFTETLPNESVITTVSGSLGIGKSQLLIEYAYRHRNDYTAIFWVSAISTNATNTSFINIMQQIIFGPWGKLHKADPDLIYQELGVSHLRDGDDDIEIDNDSKEPRRSHEAVSNWLGLPGNNKWLIIFDDTDDWDTSDRIHYLRSHCGGGSGSILTAHRSPFTELLFEKRIPLGLLDSNSAARSILTRDNIAARDVSDEDDADILSRELGLIPFAIDQAICFMRETKTTIRQYLSYFRGWGRTEMELKMASHNPEPHLYRGLHPVLIALEISLSTVGSSSPEASILLTCSYLDPNNILEDFFDFGDGYTSGKSTADLPFQRLDSYSLIQRTSPGLFSIHPLASSWIRDRLDDVGLKAAMRTAISILGRALRKFDVTQHTPINRFAHSQELLIIHHLELMDRKLAPDFAHMFDRQPMIMQKDTVEFIEGFYNIALYFKRKSLADKAQRWLLQAVVYCYDTLKLDKGPKKSWANERVRDIQGDMDKALRSWRYQEAVRE
ncbi:hypothetical protein TWF718_003410 [Orbilia javanica]|uniref:NB-ARC domain-containing protein n=1 Tax=Orbilia javanica TaxID=47235 RepID=A0AAN8R7W0_9PEZI